MDKNSAIGLSLILAIFIGFSIYNQPSKEEIEAAKRKRDSIAAIDQKLKDEADRIKEAVAETPTTPVATTDSTLSDSARTAFLAQQFGAFAKATEGTERTITVANDLIEVNLSTKGGHPKSVVLKDYKRHDGSPLVLFDHADDRLSLNFFSQNRRVNTRDLYFIPQADHLTVAEGDSGRFTMTLDAGEGRRIEYIYSLKSGSYVVGWEIRLVGMDALVEKQATDLQLQWVMNAPSQEKSIENQRNASTILYRFTDGEVDRISERKQEKEELKTGLQWVAFKQQFFSTVLMASDKLEAPTNVEVKWNETDSATVKTMMADLTIPFRHLPEERVAFQFYYGPNHYQSLRKMNRGLDELVPLGWGIFGWVNRFAVIPVFNLLGSLNLSYGIIILLLTILLKLVLLPLTFKAYMSTAKMKVLKPEIDELNAKLGDKDPLAKQQATMDLYRKAGVNPMGGCLPMLLQMPILIALFNFFPASIELRQQAFLWADDLSTYDSIYNLPFNIPFYGSHVSLFTLLMTVSTILYTRMNSSTMNMDNPQMKQMQWMMYLMPIVFLGVFNNYAAGLSYYYFLANMITFGQQYLFKVFVDEDKLHRQIQENKKKPVKKSAFQKKLEDMAKQRGLEQPNARKK